ncbi:glycosyltransferase family 39 protein [Williamsia maris]|uniref:Mannosyltransferase PIG-V n=1 Tax=Williamsia maris TaxID=72806 RepID=A0ABT1HD71_9NOCA|nr:glycosyltransferase family 39 protein [Williamsia maris]MCP2175655.1 hypothetical protein [Williamsia maris]
MPSSSSDTVVSDGSNPNVPTVTAASAQPGVIARNHSWLTPVALFLAVRLIGVLVLARFTDLRGGSLREALSSWDGKWMLDIAQYGYGGVPFSQADAHGYRDANTPYAFFPGYPMLVGAVAKIPGFSTFGAAMTVNVVVGCIGAVGAARLGALCCRLMAERTGLTGRNSTTGWFTDNLRVSSRISMWLNSTTSPTKSAVGSSTAGADPRRVGLILVVLFAAAPMGVVLSMAYTETLFCSLAVWALVGVLEKRWVLAGVVTMFAGLTRPTAVVLVGVVMLAALLAHRDGPKAWAAVVLSPLGYLGYLGVVWHQTGSPTGWFTIQTQGWGTEIDWGKTSWQFINYSLINSSEVAVVATAWIMIATIALVAVCIWERLPWPVVLYGTLVVISIAGSSGLMMSRPRLLLPAFVMLIPAAIALARSRPFTQLWVLAAVVALSSWFGAHMLTVYPHAI